MLRTEIIEYILTQINAIIKIQKIVRGFFIHRKYFEYINNSKILGPMVKKIFLVWLAKKKLKKLRAQQVNFFIKKK